MRLIKVNDTDYVNPEQVIRVSREKDKDDPTKNVWYVYTLESKIKTNQGFNVKSFVRRSR